VNSRSRWKGSGMNSRSGRNCCGRGLLSCCRWDGCSCANCS